MTCKIDKFDGLILTVSNFLIRNVNEAINYENKCQSKLPRFYIKSFDLLNCREELLAMLLIQKHDREMRTH